MIAERAAFFAQPCRLYLLRQQRGRVSPAGRRPRIAPEREAGRSSEQQAQTGEDGNFHVGSPKCSGYVRNTRVRSGKAKTAELTTSDYVRLPSGRDGRSATRIAISSRCKPPL